MADVASGWGDVAQIRDCASTRARAPAPHGLNGGRFGRLFSLVLWLFHRGLEIADAFSQALA